MSRVKLVGTEKEPYRLQMGDLSKGRDASYSYFYRCDFGTLDLTGFNFDCADFIHCFGSPNLTGVSDLQLMSRWTDFTGATFSKDIRVWNHDWVLAMIQQYIAVRASQQRHKDIMQVVVNAGWQRYETGWRTMLEAAIQAGHTFDQVKEAGAECFGPYPRLLKFDRTDIACHGSFGINRPHTVNEFFARGRDITVDYAPLIREGEYDRWGKAQELKAFVEEHYNVEVDVHVSQLHPVPVIFTAGDLVDWHHNPRWWKGSWPWDG